MEILKHLGTLEVLPIQRLGARSLASYADAGSHRSCIEPHTSNCQGALFVPRLAHSLASYADAGSLVKLQQFIARFLTLKIFYNVSKAWYIKF